MRSVIRFAPIVLTLTVSGLAAAPAFAQSAMSGNTALGLPSARANKPQGPVQPPPPAIPGAQSTPGTAAPPDRPITDMAPNAALFDAINRGDITAARDALNRGADLNAQNVLGMTPIDLSVDLGRNDITFLLLSMRGGSDQAGTAVAAAASPPPAPRREATRSRRAVEVSARMRVQAPAPPPPPRTAPLFAHDGGAPVPQAGFLGFDPGSTPR